MKTLSQKFEDWLKDLYERKPDLKELGKKDLALLAFYEGYKASVEEELEDLT